MSPYTQIVGPFGNSSQQITMKDSDNDQCKKHWCNRQYTVEQIKYSGGGGGMGGCARDRNTPRTYDRRADLWPAGVSQKGGQIRVRRTNGHPTTGPSLSPWIPVCLCCNKLFTDPLATRRGRPGVREPTLRSTVLTRHNATIRRYDNTTTQQSENTTMQQYAIICRWVAGSTKLCAFTDKPPRASRPPPPHRLFLLLLLLLPTSSSPSPNSSRSHPHLLLLVIYLHALQAPEASGCGSWGAAWWHGAVQSSWSVCFNILAAFTLFDKRGRRRPTEGRGVRAARGLLICLRLFTEVLINS